MNLGTAATLVASSALLVGCSSAAATPADPLVLGGTAILDWVVAPTLDNVTACTDAVVTVRGIRTIESDDDAGAVTSVGGSSGRAEVEVVASFRGDIAVGETITIWGPPLVEGETSGSVFDADATFVVTLASATPPEDYGYFAWGIYQDLGSGDLADLRNPGDRYTITDVRDAAADADSGVLICAILPAGGED